MAGITDDTVRIAVVEEQVRGMREQQRSHMALNQQRFDDIDRKMDELIATMNRGRGAYAASLMLAGVIGGTLLKLAGMFGHTFQR